MEAARRLLYPGYRPTRWFHMHEGMMARYRIVPLAPSAIAMMLSRRWDDDVIVM